jgi:hypothetical protein
VAAERLKAVLDQARLRPSETERRVSDHPANVILVTLAR